MAARGYFTDHHHQDHVGGVKQLREKFPSIVVYGPAETQDKGVTQVVGDGDRLSILGHDFSIFSTPGHTLGHICYYSEPYLFCGDTMFFRRLRKAVRRYSRADVSIIYEN